MIIYIIGKCFFIGFRLKTAKKIPSPQNVDKQQNTKPVKDFAKNIHEIITLVFIAGTPPEDKKNPPDTIYIYNQRY